MQIQPEYENRLSSTKEVSILLLGGSGAGKSTFIRQLITYAIGVENKTFNIKIPKCQPLAKDAAKSFTQTIQKYGPIPLAGKTLENGIQLKINLTMWDTMGFPDTSTEMAKLKYDQVVKIVNALQIHAVVWIVNPLERSHQNVISRVSLFEQLNYCTRAPVIMVMNGFRPDWYDLRGLQRPQDTWKPNGKEWTKYKETLAELKEEQQAFLLAQAREFVKDFRVMIPVTFASTEPCDMGEFISPYLVNFLYFQKSRPIFMRDIYSVYSEHHALMVEQALIEAEMDFYKISAEKLDDMEVFCKDIGNAIGGGGALMIAAGGAAAAGGGLVSPPLMLIGVGVAGAGLVVRGLGLYCAQQGSLYRIEAANLEEQQHVLRLQIKDRDSIMVKLQEQHAHFEVMFQSQKGIEDAPYDLKDLKEEFTEEQQTVDAEQYLFEAVD